MWRLLSWIGKIVATAYGGPGIVVLGDPGLDPEIAGPTARRWGSRIAVLTTLIILVLILIGLAWPIVAAVAAIPLLPLSLNRIQALRGRRR